MNGLVIKNERIVIVSPARVVRVEGGGKVERNEKRKPLLRIMRNEKCSSIAVTSRKHIVKHPDGIALIRAEGGGLAIWW